MASLNDLQAEFADILMEHEDIVSEAREVFSKSTPGLRMAALPRGLMPLADAQKVVNGFDASTAKLREFINTLYKSFYKNVPTEVETDYKEMLKKAEKALAKFEADQQVAQKALAKHEDLLVGEHFQEAFEAVRHAVLDLDLVEGTNIGFKTVLSLNDNPPHADGFISIWHTGPGKREVYRINVGYKAVDDTYYGSVIALSSNRTFKTSVKEGSTRVKAFAKHFANKVQSLAEAEGEALFGTRKKVEVSEDVAQYGKGDARMYMWKRSLAPALKASPSVKDVTESPYLGTLTAKGASEWTERAEISVTKDAISILFSGETVPVKVTSVPDAVNAVKAGFQRQREKVELKGVEDAKWKAAKADLDTYVDAVKKAFEALPETASVHIRGTNEERTGGTRAIVGTTTWLDQAVKWGGKTYTIAVERWFPSGKVVGYMAPSGTGDLNVATSGTSPRAIAKGLVEAVVALREKNKTPADKKQEAEAQAKEQQAGQWAKDRVKIRQSLDEYIKALIEAFKALPETLDAREHSPTEKPESGFITNWVDQSLKIGKTYQVAITVSKDKAYAYFGPAGQPALPNHVQGRGSAQTFAKAIVREVMENRKVSEKSEKSLAKATDVAARLKEKLERLPLVKKPFGNFGKDDDWKDNKWVSTGNLKAWIQNRDESDSLYVKVLGNGTIELDGKSGTTVPTVSQAVDIINERFTARQNQTERVTQEVAASGREWDAALARELKPLGFAQSTSKITYSAIVLQHAKDREPYKQEIGASKAKKVPADATSVDETLAIVKPWQDLFETKEVTVDAGGRKFRVIRMGEVRSLIVQTPTGIKEVSRWHWDKGGLTEWLKGYFTDFANVGDLELPEEFKAIGTLRTLAKGYGVDISDVNTDKEKAFRRLMPSIAKDPKYPQFSHIMTHAPKVLSITVDGPKFAVDLDKGAKMAAAARVAREHMKQAGGTTFENYAEGANSKQAFRDAIEEAGRESGYGGDGGYAGNITAKASEGFTIRSETPMTMKDARAFADKDLENNDKWGPAFAVPVSEPRLVKKETVTVTVEAKDEKEALRQGAMRIRATGHVPPKVTIQVPDAKATLKEKVSPRVSTWTVTGTRSQVVLGEIKGWLFYGWASS